MEKQNHLVTVTKRFKLLFNTTHSKTRMVFIFVKTYTFFFRIVGSFFKAGTMSSSMILPTNLISITFYFILFLSIFVSLPIIHREKYINIYNKYHT